MLYDYSGVIHASAAISDLRCLSLGCVRAKRAASQGRGPPGPPGPPGPAGPAGPPGSGAGGAAIRVTTGHCDRPVCGASCEENEQILNAYALNPGGEIAFVDQRNVTFRRKEQSTILVTAKAPRRRRFPSKIGRASPLPPLSCQLLPRLRSSEAVRCRNGRSKDRATRACHRGRTKFNLRL
jgi:hypothetical protein